MYHGLRKNRAFNNPIYSNSTQDVSVQDKRQFATELTFEYATCIAHVRYGMLY